MKSTAYHQHLLQDEERLAGFLEAIKEKSRGIVYDLGTGSGIFASWAAPYSDFVFAVEKDPKTAKIAKKNLSTFKNIELIEADASNLVFPKQADLIICEMLDTALIDEEQVPVLNNAIKYLKTDGDIIPSGVINSVELVELDVSHISYQEGSYQPQKILSSLKFYNKIDFKKPIKDIVNTQINFTAKSEGILSGLRITTFTLLTKNLIMGPTPMLNPPLLIPLNPKKIRKKEKINLDIKYQMGGGLNTLEARFNSVF